MQDPAISDFAHGLPLSQFTLAPMATTDLPDRIELSRSHIQADTPFYLHRSEQEDSEIYQLAGEIPANFYVDENVVSGVTYYYRVVPVRGTTRASFSVAGKAHDVAVSRHLASVSETSGSFDLEVDAERDMLYLASQCPPLSAYDIADIRNPVEIYGPETESMNPSVMQIVGDNLFRSARGRNVEVFDINPASPTYLDEVGEIPFNSTKGFAVDGDYAYCQGYDAYGSYFQVFDISGFPSVVAECAKIVLPSVFVLAHELGHDPSTDRVFIGGSQYQSGDAAFCTYDVSTPASPVLVTNSVINYGALNVTGIEVEGDFVYLSIGQFGVGFHVVDVSNPPTSYANNFTFPVPEGKVNAIDVDVMYVAAEDSGLHRYSLDTSLYPSEGITLERIFPEPEFAQKFRIVGDRAYVVNGMGGFDIVSIGEDRFDLSGHGVVNGPTVVDGRDVCIRGSHAYLETRTGMLVFDISNPDSPEHVSGYPPAGADEVLSRGFAMSGDYAFLNDLNTGCHVIDVSDLAAPYHVSTFLPETPFEETASANYSNYRCAVLGEHLYLPDYDRGVSVVSIADPASPFRVSHIPMTGDHSQEVMVRDDLPFAADYLVGLRIFNISDPVSPVQVGAYTTDLNPVGIDIEGDLCYIANYHGDLTILDVADPGNPALVSTLTIYPDASWTNDDTLFDVEVTHGLAFITAYRWGLVVVDVCNPEDPLLETIYDVPESEWMRGVRMYDDRLYVAATSRTTIKALNIFDIRPVD